MIVYLLLVFITDTKTHIDIFRSADACIEAAAKYTNIQRKECTKVQVKENGYN